MSLIKKLAGETALYGLSSILGRLLSFVFLTPFLTRFFNNNQAQIGIQTDLYAWVAFLMIVFTYRIETAFFKFGADAVKRATTFRTAATMLLASTVFLVSLMVLTAPYTAAWLGYAQHSEFVIWFAFVLGFDALSALPFALLRLQGKALKFALVKIINLFVHLGFVLLFLYVLPNYYPAWYDPDLGIAYVFIANLLASAMTFVLLLSTYRFAFKPFNNDATVEQVVFDKQLLKKMFLYSMPLTIAGFAGVINEVIDRILLKAFLPGNSKQVLIQVGIYGACYKLAILMNLFTQAFNYAAEPFFFRNAQKQYARQLYADIALLFCMVGSFGFLAIMLNMQIVQYFVGSNFREGLIIVPYLLVANLFLGLYYNVAVWYKINNQTKYGAVIAIIGAIITIVANIAGIPLFIYLQLPGYLGAAVATLLCYATMVMLCYLLGQKHYPIPYQIKKILLHIVLVVLIYVLYVQFIRPLSNDFWLGLLLSNTILVLYILLLYVLEKKQLKQILGNAPKD